MSSREEFVEWYQNGLKKKLCTDVDVDTAYIAFDRYVKHGLSICAPRRRRKQPSITHATTPTLLGYFMLLPGDVMRILYRDYYLAGKMACLSSAFRTSTLPIIEEWRYSPIIGHDLLSVLPIVRDAYTINWLPETSPTLPERTKEREHNFSLLEDATNKLGSLIDGRAGNIAMVELKLCYAMLHPTNTSNTGVENIKSVVLGSWRLSCQKGEQFRVEKLHTSNVYTLSDIENGINWWLLIMHLQSLGRNELVIPCRIAKYILERRFSSVTTNITITSTIITSKDHASIVQRAYTKLVRGWFDFVCRGLYCTVPELMGRRLLPASNSGGFVLDPVLWTTEELQTHKDAIIRHYVNHDTNNLSLRGVTIMALSLKKLEDLAKYLDNCAGNNSVNKVSPIPTHYTSKEDVQRVFDLLVRAHIILSARENDIEECIENCRALYRKSNTTFGKLRSVECLFGSLMSALMLMGELFCTTHTNKKVVLQIAHKTYNISAPTEFDAANWGYTLRPT